jgi:hypothetical protein
LQDPAEDTKTSSSSEEQKTKKNYGALEPAGPSAGDDSKNDEEKQEEGAVLVITPAKNTLKQVDPETLKPHRPNQNACLWMFHLLAGISTAAAICLLITQLLPFFLVKFADIPARIGILSTALKLYISLFCILFVLTETGAPVGFIRNSALLQTYLSRGILYSFLGLICVEEAYSERVKDIVERQDEFHLSWAAIFMEVSSWLFLGTGALYMLLGLCCLKRLRDRLRQNEIDSWKKYREDLKAWNDKYGR